MAKMHPGAIHNLSPEHVEGTRMGEYPVIWAGDCLGWYRSHSGTVTSKSFYYNQQPISIYKTVHPMLEMKRDVLVWRVELGTREAVLGWLRENGRLAE